MLSRISEEEKKWDESNDLMQSVVKVCKKAFRMLGYEKGIAYESQAYRSKKLYRSKKMQQNKQSQGVRNNSAKNTWKRQYHWVAMSKYVFISVVVNICLCVCYYKIDLLFYGQRSRLKEKKKQRNIHTEAISYSLCDSSILFLELVINLGA